MIDSPFASTRASSTGSQPGNAELGKIGRASRRPPKPTYLVLGPPGAGKSSVLSNSGLGFERDVVDAAARRFDASAFDIAHDWPCEDAKFIECAGRLLSETSAQGDETSWNDLLRRLKRVHARRAVNGVLIVMPLDAIAVASHAQVQAVMRAVRKRLGQLEDALRLRPPVYVIVTKSDKLAGFSEYFHDLVRERAEQPLGVTLPLADTESATIDTAARLSQSLLSVTKRLARGTLAVLHSNSEFRRSAGIFAFPDGLAKLAPRLQVMLEGLLLGSRLQPSPRLRGLYLVSSTRTGHSVDLVGAELLDKFGFDAPFVEDTPADPQPLFLAELFRNVILTEQNLVVDAGVDRPDPRGLRRLGAAAFGAVALVMVLFWIFAYLDQSRYVADARAGLVRYVLTTTALSARDVADSDLEKAEQSLDAARGAAGPSPPAVRLGAFSFDQSPKIEMASRDLLNRAREGYLLPRLLVALQTELDAPDRARTQIEDVRQIYLTLGGHLAPGAKSASALTQSMLDRIVPSVSRPAFRRALDADVAALFSSSRTPIVLEDWYTETRRLSVVGPVSP